MQQFLSSILLALSLTAVAPASQVLFLDTIPYHHDISFKVVKSPATAQDQLFIDIEDTYPPTIIAPIFKDVILGVNDVGITHVADANAPGFEDFARLLTDGIDETLFIPSGISSSTGRFEHEWFQKDGTTEFDLKGYSIDRVTYTITGYDYVSPGRDPNHDGQWTDVYLGSVFTIEGSPIPEPMTFALLSGLVAPVGIWRRR